jgi:hypothetical protein
MEGISGIQMVVEFEVRKQVRELVKMEGIPSG